jgi:UDP-N-acetylglucosamine--N-acetylmuramyl-(pentapeptide) pyrophosphoryl-undecaprenol N-acetylglucosamine transferase
MRKPGKVLLVAGGTGGHIIPAAAFGGWVARNHPDVGVRYMSGRRSVELEIYRSLKIEPCVLPMEGSPIGAPGGQRIKRWAGVARAFAVVWKFMRDERPDLCVLFGGYASAAALVISSAGGIRTIAHEQNACAGRVTRLAKKMGAFIASGWENCRPLEAGSFERVGVPVRPMESMSRTEAERTLGLSPDREFDASVAVMTGSLGSGNITETIGAVSRMDGFDSWRFTIVNPSIDAPKRVSPHVTHLPAMWNISPLFNSADLLVTRGGASTLAEVEASGIPAVVIPWRGAAEDHQTANAMELSKSGMIEIWDEDAGKLPDLARILRKLRVSFPLTQGDIGKRMYNASDDICKRLWNFCCELREGRD